MVSSDLSSIINKNSDIYSAKASLNDKGGIDPATSTVTGDRTTGLFKNATDEMGKDDFLLLLVTQLKYQDPLNPMQNTEFVSQLAQFRSLEANTNIESAIGKLGDSFKGTLDAQNASAQSLNNSAAVSMIGKTVRLKQSEIEWMAKAGANETFRVNLGKLDSASIQIRDEDGNVVKTLLANDKDAENSQTIVWDGSTDTGTTAQSGKYSIHIDGEESNPSLYAFVEDSVSGVRFTSDGAVVKIAGKELPLNNVLDVTGAANGSAGMLSPSTALSLIGKEIRVKQDSVRYNNRDDENVLISINGGGRDYVAVELTDKLGNTVYSKTVPVDQYGIANLQWNGMTNAGQFAEAGQYFIEIAGQNTDPTLYSFAQGKVTGVMNLGGDPRLRVGSVTVNMSDVIDIAEPEEVQGGEV